MKCPSCQAQETKVVDSRSAPSQTSIRRRRLCPQCNKRFTTRETIEVQYPRVTKKTGVRCVFDENKIRLGVTRAVEKRNIDHEQIENIVASISEKVVACATNDEITSRQIGLIVMESLRLIDEVAYVRFASVYQSFASIESFLSIVQQLKSKEKEVYESEG